MAKIKAVTVDYEEELPVFGAVAIIHLDNNGTLFLALESKANDPAFDILRDHKRVLEVKTDGDGIYWSGGPRLTLDDIMEMLREDGDGNG